MEYCFRHSLIVQLRQILLPAIRLQKPCLHHGSYISKNAALLIDSSKTILNIYSNDRITYMKINFPNKIGFILLGVYLILIGISAVLPTITVPSIVYSILALAAGILILIGV